MIHEVYLLLRAALKAKGVPYEFLYGPTQVPVKVGATRLQIVRPEGSDQVMGPRSQHRNAIQFSTRAMGATILVYAHSTVEGAHRHDHERLADRLVDQLQVEIQKVVRVNKTLWRVLSAGIVTPVAGSVSDDWAGVVYELRFQIDRGVRDVSWVGDAAAEFETDGFLTTPTITGPGVSDGLPSGTTRIES